MSKVSIPVFKLYGEALGWPTPDLLHSESIAARSCLHHWEIEPHRHADLWQLLFLYKGQAEIELEGQVRCLREAAIQVVPALCVHGFRFSEDVDGYVVTLAAPSMHFEGGLTMIDHGQGGHLVRNRQIAACKTQHRECTQCSFYVLWLNR